MVSCPIVRTSCANELLWGWIILGAKYLHWCFYIFMKILEEHLLVALQFRHRGVVPSFVLSDTIHSKPRHVQFSFVEKSASYMLITLVMSVSYKHCRQLPHNFKCTHLVWTIHISIEHPYIWNVFPMQTCLHVTDSKFLQMCAVSALSVSLLQWQNCVHPVRHTSLCPLFWHMQYKTLLMGKHEAMHYSSQIEHFITVQPKHRLQFGNIPTLQRQTLPKHKKRIHRYPAASSDGWMVN